MGQITESLVRKLKTPPTGKLLRWDGEIPGFGVSITAGGVTAFVLSYRAVDKRTGQWKKFRYTIGRYPEYSATAARDEAIDLRGRIRKGYNPLQEREEQRQQAAGEPTINDLAKRYLEEHAFPRKRALSARNDQRKLAGIVQPRLGEFLVKGVTQSDVTKLHNSLKATPYHANRVLALLSKMFSLAVKWGLRQDNPCKGIPRFQEDRRERWLTVEEMQRLMKAMDAYHDQNAANAIRLLLLTGAREGEVLKADWTQFDLERATWTKPSHHTKQKKIEHVPLSKPALDLLQKMKPKASGPLFPGAKKDSARVVIRKPWMQVCKAAGLASPVEKQGKRRKIIRWKPTVRIHDLRHTYASHLVSKGESLQIVGKLLGHTRTSTTERYAHVADEALRDATNRFGAILNGTKEVFYIDDDENADWLHRPEARRK